MAHLPLLPETRRILKQQRSLPISTSIIIQARIYIAVCSWLRYRCSKRQKSFRSNAEYFPKFPTYILKFCTLNKIKFPKVPLVNSTYSRYSNENKYSCANVQSLHRAQKHRRLKLFCETTVDLRFLNFLSRWTHYVTHYNYPCLFLVDTPNKLSNNTSVDILLCVNPPKTIIPDEHEHTQCPVLPGTSEESIIILQDVLVASNKYTWGLNSLRNKLRPP